MASKIKGDVPMEIVPDSDIRIYYEGQWVDFRNGKVLVSHDESHKGEVADGSSEKI